MKDKSMATSLDITSEKINALKQILPEAFSEGKIDWEKLKATLGENIDFRNERYTLNWAGKSDAFRLLQTPSTKTLIPAKNKGINFDETGNVFIEGENLEVLKVLQKSYHGKVKMIYIDPPYNTGNDSFIYPDDYAERKDDYLTKVGDKDDEGYVTNDYRFAKNTKENGQYHSNWLNMMMPRLYLAKNLLREDGVIFVSIDDNEVHNLRLLMNEIFGEENFVAQIIWENKEGGGGSDSKHFRIKHEYVLVYSKSKEQVVINGVDVEDVERYKLSDKHELERGKYQLIKLDSASLGYVASLDYPIQSPDGTDIYPNKDGQKISRWRWSKEKLDWGVKNDFVVIKKDKDDVWAVYTKQYLYCDHEGNLVKRTIQPIGVISKYSTTQSNKYIKDVFSNVLFQYSKPHELISYYLKTATSPDDLILDFFAGSGTTAHAVMELNKEDGGNRKYICVQLPEPCDEKSEAYKAGYKTIAEITKERIRRASRKIADEIQAGQDKKKGKLDLEQGQDRVIDLGFKVLKLADSNFKQWKAIDGNDIDTLMEQIDLFVDPIAGHATDEGMIYELLLKNGKDINSQIVAEDGFYSIDNGDMILMLTETSQEIINSVISRQPTKVIALDRLFEGNDQLKTNTVLQMKDANITFKTI